MTKNSCVPRSWCEMTSERIASSLARPPALRITCASPSLRPANFAGSSRASMQVRIVNLRAGGIASPPWSKSEAYWSLALRTSSRIGISAPWDGQLDRARSTAQIDCRCSVWHPETKGDVGRPLRDGCSHGDVCVVGLERVRERAEARRRVLDVDRL